MILRKINDRDVGQIVEIHLRSFPGFFLSFLGPRFLSLYYESISTTDHGIGFISIASTGFPEGSVAGTTNPRGFYSQLLKRSGIRFFIASITAVFKKPTIVPRLARALFHPSENPIGEGVAGLFSVAVLPEAQGKGVGSKLVRAFLCEAHKRGCDRVFLTTDQDKNEATNRLYEKMGFKIERQYVTPEGRRMNEYWFDLSAGYFAGENTHA
jgi:ribosomal protein S18 acetylase RimI-like enzyme